MTIAERVERVILSSLCGEQPLPLTTDLRDGLGFDSLDLSSLAVGLEEEFGIDIPDDEIDSLRTVGDVIQYIDRRTTMRLAA